VNIDFILFSKLRTLQTRSLLLSLRHYTNLPEERIRVLYVEDEKIRYDRLQEEFSCRFVQQGDFLADVRRLVAESTATYLGFLIDDTICRDRFSLARVEQILDANPDLDAFSLRLGENITHGGPQPHFLPSRDEDLLVWDTTRGQGRYWNYFWEISASVYRRSLVERYLARCRPDRENYPNPFESHFFTCMPNTTAGGLVRAVNSLRFLGHKHSHRMACFHRSKCLTQGINKVGATANRGDTIHTPKELHRMMEEGMIVDFHSLHEAPVTNPNADYQFFRLIHERELPTPASQE
jgi:hypothetical protein